MPNSNDHTNDSSLEEGLNPTNFQKIVALLEKEIELEQQAEQEKTKRNAKREEEETNRYKAKMEEEKSHDNNMTERSKARAAVLKALEVADDAALEVLHDTLKSGKEQASKNELEKKKEANKKEANKKEANTKEPEALVEATNSPSIGADCPTNAAADKMPTPDTKKSPRRNSAGNSANKKVRVEESAPGAFATKEEKESSNEVMEKYGERIKKLDDKKTAKKEATEVFEDMVDSDSDFKLLSKALIKKLARALELMAPSGEVAFKELNIKKKKMLKNHM